MSSFKTTWVIDLVEKVTSPFKKMRDNITTATKSADDFGEKLKFTQKEAKDALKNTSDEFKRIKASLRENEIELKKLEKAYKDARAGKDKFIAKDAFEKQKRKVENLRTSLKGTEDDLKDINEQLDKFKRKQQNWTDFATGINQSIELLNRANQSLQFASGVRNLSTEIQRLTDLTDDSLDTFVQKSREIGDVYRQEPIEVAKAANAMTKELGGSYEENLRLIEDGFKRGANANGDFLDSMKEYSPQLKQLGLDGSQAIAMIAKAGKEGIYMDKAVDSLKEANLSLREMGTAQVDALSGIGIKVEDLAGKTTMEAVQMIAKAMQGASTQAKQLVLADIFKGAGEDAGLSFVEGYASGIPDLSTLPVVEESASGMKAFFSNISTWAGNALGDIAVISNQLEPVISIIAGAIPIIGLLTKSTSLMTLATSLWSKANKILSISIMGTPIGWIMAGIAAVIGIVMLVSKYTTGWGEAWDHTLNGMKSLFKGWVAGIKLYFTTLVQGFMIGIDKIRLSWYQFKESMGLGDTQENQAMISSLKKQTEDRKKEITEAAADVAKHGIEAVGHFKKAGSSIKLKEAKNEKEGGLNEYLLPDAERLSFNEDENDNKKDKKQKGDGLSVGSGSGGIKNITMTLNITNHFSVAKDSNMRQVADAVIGPINDRLRDAVINLG